MLAIYIPTKVSWVRPITQTNKQNLFSATIILKRPLKLSEIQSVDIKKNKIVISQMFLQVRQESLDIYVVFRISEAVAQRCSVKKVLLEISQNSQETPVSESLF